jgi:sugar lactone lactonase YvrE
VDSGNLRVRRVDQAGFITTYAGNGTSSDTGDGGPAIDAALNEPGGLVVDGAGNVYVAEFDSQDIRKIDTQGVITTFAYLPSWPDGMAIDGEGNVYVALFTQNQILVIRQGGLQAIVAGAGSPGYSGDGGQAAGAMLNAPSGVWVDVHGNLFINDSGNFVIRKVDPTGTISTVAGSGKQGYSGDDGPATEADISSQYGVVVDAAGEIFISDTSNDVIRMVDACGIIHTVAGSGSTTFTPLPGPALDVGLSSPGYAWMDPAGAMYFSDANSAVYRISH